MSMQQDKQAPDKFQEESYGLVAGLGGFWVILFALLCGGSFYVFLILVMFIVLPALAPKPKKRRRR